MVCDLFLKHPFAFPPVCALFDIALSHWCFQTAEDTIEELVKQVEIERRIVEGARRMSELPDKDKLIKQRKQTFVTVHYKNGIVICGIVQVPTGADESGRARGPVTSDDAGEAGQVVARK